MADTPTKPQLGCLFFLSASMWEPMWEAAEEARVSLVMAESHIGWIPYLLQRMDRKFDEGDYTHRCKVRPSELFRRQVWATFQDDRVGCPLAEEFAPDSFCWGSDYPHADGTWPDSGQFIEETMGELSPELREKILCSNVERLYELVLTDSISIRHLPDESKIPIIRTSRRRAMTEFQLTDEHVRDFENDGATCLRGFVNEQWLDRLRQAAQIAMNQYPPHPGMYYFKRIRLWEEISEFGALCTESHLPAMAARFLRTNKVNLLYDQLFVKDASMVERTAWHNDQPYWPVRGGGAMSFWVALEDLDETMGTLELIRGSHAWEAWYQPFIGNELGNVKNIPERLPGFIPMPDFDAERDRHEMIRWNLAAGDAVAFHALAVHSSTGNVSKNTTRWAYSVRYAAEDNRYLDVTGVPGHNVNLDNPELKTGDRLDSEMFPVVYRASA